MHKGLVAAIADGMSGSEGGRQASHCCVASFLADYYSTPDSWSVKQAGQKVLSATNSWLYSQGQSRFQSAKGMVSTLSILVLKSTTAHLFHVGDSRIYRLRRNNLEQLTRDHRVWISHEKNYLNRAMGIEPRLEVDYKSCPLEQGDLFLMTTDGVHDFIDEKSLKNLLLEIPDLDYLADKILQIAKNNHSDDNLTCQLLRVESLADVKEDEILRRHANLPFPPPLAAGMVLDGYRIEAELHASKRTQVYLATDSQNGRKVVLKTPSILYDDDAQFIEHFLHEEWAGKRINHDNVVKIINTNRQKSWIYYVTEYLEGLTLRAWMDAHPKPDINTVQAIVGQIAKGLRAFHRKEMLHQDLKPENIIIDGKSVIKIIDFGSVKIAGIAEITTPKANEENILGTMNYTAPEYHLNQRGSVKSDLYSLGVIAYELLNGALPFGNFPDKPNAGNLVNLSYRPSFHFNPMVPIWIDGALKKATSLTPQSRYEDLSEFIYDLNHPNPAFLRTEDHIPLLQRNPMRFWQVLCLILLISNLVLIFKLAAD
jgi:serine/threonine protein kinase